LGKALKKQSRGLRDPRIQWSIALIVIMITGVFLYISYLPDLQVGGLKIDWRVKLHIVDYRYNINSTPPSGIGAPWGQYWFNHTYDRLNGVWVGPPDYAPINTRDDTGTIYVQYAVCCPAYVFTLSYFFSEWGQTLTKTCVGNYCYSPGETITYDTNDDNIFQTGEPVIHAAGNIAPASNTVLKTDPHLRFIGPINSVSWSSGDPIVYDTNNNGIYDAGDVLVSVSEPPRGSTLTFDPKIKYVDSNSDGTYNFPVTPPVLVSTKDTSRCDPSVLGLSDKYDWTIWEWRPTLAAAANCFPTSGV